MKACRKIAALALCAVLLVSLMPIVFAADAAPALQFDENGEFKILIVADTQDIDKPQKETIALLEAELDAAQPDLVVFLGDQIHGLSIGKSVERTQKALDAFLQPVAERGLQFAVVFGNHDDEGGVSKETQMAYYQSYPGCLAAAGDVTGVGNYNLLVYDSDGKTPVVNLWFFDSGSYAPEGQGKYDWVRQDQIDWYLETEAALAARNGGTPIPAYAFQHIIVPDIYDAMDIVPSSEKKNGAVEGYGCRKGTYYSAASVIEAGTLGEAPCPPDVNGGEFAAWKQGGDIVAGFFGHDHVNDFIIPYEGIDLINTNSTGFYIYGAGENHGARLVTLCKELRGAVAVHVFMYNQHIIVGHCLRVLVSHALIPDLDSGLVAARDFPSVKALGNDGLFHAGIGVADDILIGFALPVEVLLPAVNADANGRPLGGSRSADVQIRNQRFTRNGNAIGNIKAQIISHISFLSADLPPCKFVCVVHSDWN